MGDDEVGGPRAIQCLWIVGVHADEHVFYLSTAASSRISEVGMSACDVEFNVNFGCFTGFVVPDGRHEHPCREQLSIEERAPGKHKTYIDRV